jgi:hypothetical protein
MRRASLWAMCVGVLVGVGVLGVVVGHAGDDTVTCSVATLSGTYVSASDGVQIRDKDRVPFASAGLDVFDGAGQVKGVFSISFNGLIEQNLTLSGTYTVNADCTGTWTTTDSTGSTVVHFDLFIAPDGSHFTFVQTDPGFVTSGSERRGSREKVSLLD